MGWVVRAGCAVIAVGAMAGVARGYCEESRQEGELAVVPAGGGVFVVQRSVAEGCRMMMVGGGTWVPLEAERRPAGEVVLYRPVRALVPGVVYEVVGVDEEGERVRYLRAVAGAAHDVAVPRWRRTPRVVWSRYRAGCLMDEALVEFALEVEDGSEVRVVIEARALDGNDVHGAMEAVVRPRNGRAQVAWPASGEWFVRAGTRYAARACAEDASGNRSCARGPALFTAPAWEPEPAPERRWPFWLAFGGGELDEEIVVGPPPPPEEKMEVVRAPRLRVDWRCASAGAAGAAMVLLVAAVVAGRRAARRRLGRTA